jgi:hypothetical protein
MQNESVKRMWETNPMADNDSRSSGDPLAELARLIGQAGLHSPTDNSFRKEMVSHSYDDGFRKETASQSYALSVWFEHAQMSSVAIKQVSFLFRDRRNFLRWELFR